RPQKETASSESDLNTRPSSASPKRRRGEWLPIFRTIDSMSAKDAISCENRLIRSFVGNWAFQTPRSRQRVIRVKCPNVTQRMSPRVGFIPAQRSELKSLSTIFSSCFALSKSELFFVRPVIRQTKTVSTIDDRVP